jgi:hypothetical protein
MAWMRMPGQVGAAATFIGMWSVMMVAMMLPVFLPDAHALSGDGRKQRYQAVASHGSGRRGLFLRMDVGRCRLSTRRCASGCGDAASILAQTVPCALEYRHCRSSALHAIYFLEKAPARLLPSGARSVRLSASQYACRRRPLQLRHSLVFTVIASLTPSFSPSASWICAQWRP